MTISLILTVRNEADALPRLLDSIAAQTRAPDEIVVVDGGSTDGTLELLRARARQLPLTILSAPGTNISQGRNIAIRAARGDIICSTDAGVQLDARWVEEITNPLDDRRQTTDQKPQAEVVAGFFIPDPQSVFETALAATTLPALAEIRAEEFLPSSRSIAFRKSAWQAVGGYPEWLDYCEDLVFDFKLRAQYRFAFAPRALVYFRPRARLGAFFAQYYFYARGDGKANLWFLRHAIRYATYFAALPLLIALTFVFPPAAIPLWSVAAAFMFFTPYRRLRSMLRGLTLGERLRAILWAPLIRVAGDVAKMIGYPVGVVWRIRNKARVVDTEARVA